MKTTTANTSGYSLIEVLVYISVLVVLMGVGYAAVYRCMSNSIALRRSAEDIANTLHAGERWRVDVRGAGENIRVETNLTEQVFYLRVAQQEVAYRFSTNTVSRRVGNGEWLPTLVNVKATTFVADRRDHVSAWRWELELQPRVKRLSNIQPRFTFLAVPTGNSEQ